MIFRVRESFHGSHICPGVQDWRICVAGGRNNWAVTTHSTAGNGFARLGVAFWAEKVAMAKGGQEQKTSNQQGMDDFYRDLRVLYENSFPKVCASCGRRYEDMASFISDTEQTHGSSGLMHVRDMSDRTQVMLFRNCRCGSTLMVECQDRRSSTPEGQAARAAFGRLLARLRKLGIAAHEARAELLKYMRGQSSERLESWLKKLNG